MKLLRWPVRLVVYGALSAGVWNLGWRLADSGSAGLAGLLGDLAILEREHRKELEHTARMEAIRHRTDARRGLTRELIDGRTSLREAAARLRALYCQWPPVPAERLRANYPACSEEQLYCRLTIGWVEFELSNDGVEGEGILARLEGELADLLPYLHLARFPDPD